MRNFIKEVFVSIPGLLALVIASRFYNSNLVPNSVLLVSLLLFIVHSIKGRINIQISFLILLLYIPLNLIVANPSPLFHSWERYVLFSAVFVAVTPIIQGERAVLNRKKCLTALIAYLVLLSTGSFFAYYLGINNMNAALYDEEIYTSAPGAFGGLSYHSMVLGPACVVAVLTCLYYYLETRKMLFIIMIVLSTGSLFFSASRISFMAAIIGSATLLFLFFPQKSRAFKYLIFIVFIAVITYPLWESITGLMQDKVANHSGESIFDSREVKFSQRLQEFSSSPIYGIGFSSIDTNGGDSYNRINGTIEPGSSWLAVLSMLGIVGGVIVVNILRITAKTLRIRVYTRQALLFSLFIAMIVHMTVEGHIFAGGSELCFLVWLIIGSCAESNIAGEEFLLNNI